MEQTGDNGMHFAALQGNVAMLKLLINAGADVNAEGRVSYCGQSSV
tara:strand:- start:17 stop:154 length:138 start_codon:yes stop_codon:yes gene_type:complete